eukprot:gene20483-27271_t
MVCCHGRLRTSQDAKRGGTPQRPLANSALAESSGSLQLVRKAHNDAARYSPKLFGKEKPVDRGSTFMPQNAYIEAWVWRRDHFEREFSWTVRNTVEVGYYIVGLTVGFYALAVFAMRQSDSRNGYPKRNMLFAETKDKAFVLPNELEFY